jgi:uroporphyrin-III C-methyltransferase
MKNIETTLRNVGTVSLVGAGPGDPELLTIKAAKAIAAATVLLVDDLVSPAIVALAPPGARVIHVGKRGGCKSTPQAFIEKLMVMAAREGETVVRLKGGDPFIFGRGGEEVEHLRAQGITVQVINGITAGLAGITSLGAPLTHREHAHGVLFITGHVRPGDSRHRLARHCRHRTRCTADAGDLHGGAGLRTHPGRAAHRSAGIDPGGRDPARQPARPAPRTDKP